MISAVSLWRMSGFNLQMDSHLIILTGIFQGFGIGLVFVPLTILAFGTLNPIYRAEGAGVFTLVRNLGSSVGISIMQALFTTNSSVVHARLVQGLRPDNPTLPPSLPPPFSLSAPAGLAALNGEVNRQAAMVAYIDDFKLMAVVAVLLIPMLLLMRSPKRVSHEDQHLALD